AEECIRDDLVTGVQTCALPICAASGCIGTLLIRRGVRSYYCTAGAPDDNRKLSKSERLIDGSPGATWLSLPAFIHCSSWLTRLRSEERRVGEECRAGCELDEPD